VDETGSAYKAGVQANDIIVKLGDKDIKAYEDLQMVLKKFRAGDQTTITVFRGGQTLTLDIVFDAKPEVLPEITQPATEPTETIDPWGDFPWDDFPWGDFG
jgi:predicted metalloprotease with PDZ domain